MAIRPQRSGGGIGAGIDCTSQIRRHATMITTTMASRLMAYPFGGAMLRADGAGQREPAAAVFQLDELAHQFAGTVEGIVNAP